MNDECLVGTPKTRPYLSVGLYQAFAMAGVDFVAAEGAEFDPRKIDQWLEMTIKHNQNTHFISRTCIQWEPLKKEKDVNEAPAMEAPIENTAKPSTKLWRPLSLLW